jgi:hypothetical protein
MSMPRSSDTPKDAPNCAALIVVAVVVSYMLVSNSVIDVVSFSDLISADLRAVTAFRPSALFHQFSFVHPHNNGSNLNETKAIIIFFNRQITLFPHFWQNTRGLVAKEKSHERIHGFWDIFKRFVLLRRSTYF